MRLILIFKTFKCDNIGTDLLQIITVVTIYETMILKQYIHIKPMSDSYIYMEMADSSVFYYTLRSPA